VLAVPVDLRRDFVVVAKRVLEPGLHRPADAEVEGMPHDHRAACLRLGRGVVDRAVVDDDDVEVGRLTVDVPHHASDHPLLVIGGDDRELAELVVVARHGGWQGGSGGLQVPVRRSAESV